MAKLKGVTSRKVGDAEYWYASIDGQKKYCGRGPEGRKIAIAAKSKDIARSYENKEINAGLKVKRAHFKTVLDIVNWYMLLPSNQKKKVYERDLSKSAHVVGFFGDKPVSAVTPDNQEKYRSFRENEGAAPGTINLEISFISKVYYLALKRKLIQSEVMPGEFIIEGKRVPRRGITPDEYERVLEHADDNARDVFICAYESAMRAGEIANLTAGQVIIDLQHISGRKISFIDLGPMDTKTGAARTVPISERLKEVLIRRLTGLSAGDYVFTNGKGRKYDKGQIAARLKKICGDAGVPYGDKLDGDGSRAGIVFHSFRHARISAWVEAGYSDEIIRRASGHQTLDAYRSYVHLDAASVMRLVDTGETGQKRDKMLIKPVK